MMKHIQTEKGTHPMEPTKVVEVCRETVPCRICGSAKAQYDLVTVRYEYPDGTSATCTGGGHCAACFQKHGLKLDD